MGLTKTAKRGAKGWIGVKAVKGAGKGASQAVRRRRSGASTAERLGKIAGAVGLAGALAFVLAKIDRRKAAGRAKGAVQSAASTVTAAGLRRRDARAQGRDRAVPPRRRPEARDLVNVNAGVVELRGELPDQAQIDQLGETARKITGVKDVNNLLHTGANSG